jgi:hypothetical protein
MSWMHYDRARVQYVDLCVECEQECHTAPVRKEQVDRYESGHLLVQEAFPELSANDREFIISGICPECWDRWLEDLPLREVYF